jgi:hypothetical protein
MGVPYFYEIQPGRVHELKLKFLPIKNGDRLGIVL